jgi:hypothetical protein
MRLCGVRWVEGRILGRERLSGAQVRAYHRRHGISDNVRNKSKCGASWDTMAMAVLEKAKIGKLLYI